MYRFRVFWAGIKRFCCICSGFGTANIVSSHQCGCCGIRYNSVALDGCLEVSGNKTGNSTDLTDNAVADGFQRGCCVRKFSQQVPACFSSVGETPDEGSQWRAGHDVRSVRTAARATGHDDYGHSAGCRRCIAVRIFQNCRETSTVGESRSPVALLNSNRPKRSPADCAETPSGTVGRIRPGRKTPAVEEVFQQEETAERVRRMLRRLPKAEYEVGILKQWEDLTFAEIAETLEKSQNNGASRYRYAMGNLQLSLESIIRGTTESRQFCPQKNSASGRCI